jgi:hypothetical protein
MGPTQKLLWKLYVGVIGAVTTIAAQRLLKAGWKLVTGDETTVADRSRHPVMTAMSWALAAASVWGHAAAHPTHGGAALGKGNRQRLAGRGKIKVKI